MGWDSTGDRKQTAQSTMDRCSWLGEGAKALGTRDRLGWGGPLLEVPSELAAGSTCPPGRQEAPPAHREPRQACTLLDTSTCPGPSPQEGPCLLGPLHPSSEAGMAVGADKQSLTESKVCGEIRAPQEAGAVSCLTDRLRARMEVGDRQQPPVPSPVPPSLLRSRAKGRRAVDRSQERRAGEAGGRSPLLASWGLWRALQTGRSSQA